MCLAPVVASALGTHAIPFSVILPSTCCLYPKDKHRLGATLPAAAILGTPSGFPHVCAPCVHLPGHSWEQPWAEFLQGNAKVERGSESQVPWTGEGCVQVTLPSEAEGIAKKELALCFALTSCWMQEDSTILCLSALIQRVWITSFISLQNDLLSTTAAKSYTLSPSAHASPASRASLIPELSSPAEDVPRGHLHSGVETRCDTTTHMAA